MKILRCERGHFYDGDKFATCPHCEKEGMQGNQEQDLYGDAVTEALTVAKATAPEPKVSLRDALENAQPSSRAIEDDDSKTVSLYQRSMGVEPVVGWLVCIEGAAFGTSFTLKSGRNFIGRSPAMDVNLAGDSSVSREKHGILIYDPKSRTFLVQAGESRELFYLNEEVVLMPMKITQGDILTIGNTRLMFFACCSDTFCWDDYKKEK